MDMVYKLVHKLFPYLKVCFIIIWISNLVNTDALFSIYALIAFGAFYLIIKNKDFDFERRRGISFLVIILALFFSSAVILANYPLFTTIGDPAVIGRSTSIMVNAIDAVFTLIGGYFTFNVIFSCFFSYFPRKNSFEPEAFSKILPLIIFASLVSIYLVHLFFVEYPGNITEDPFTQISEMVSGSYSNFNTFWHTVVFQFVLKIGFLFTSDLNAAIALFTVLQAVALAFAFAYCLMTLVRYGVPKWFVAISYIIFVFVPYNIALSITIWKDVLYAAGGLLMISSWLRISKKLNSCLLLDYFVFLLGSLLFLISRTNGWIIYLVFFLCHALFVRQNKQFTVLMAGISLLGWFLLNPALALLNVQASDPVESLSVPIQQISRVIAEGNELTAEEQQLLSRVIDLEDVPELYTEWLSDPMKVEVRSKDYDYLCDHLADYGKLWIKLGIRYPVEYVEAWVEQTKGYWNAGYDVALYSETITRNPYGVEKAVSGNIIASLFRLYFGLSRHVIFFEPLHSIGLHVWIMFVCFILNVVRKKEEWMLALPSLLIVIGLCFGTPVYYCFRYVYPMFVSMPLILATSLFSQKK